MRTVQSWICELGYGADTMFHKTYFLFILRQCHYPHPQNIFRSFRPTLSPKTHPPCGRKTVAVHPLKIFFSNNPEGLNRALWAPVKGAAVVCAVRFLWCTMQTAYLLKISWMRLMNHAHRCLYTNFVKTT